MGDLPPTSQPQALDNAATGFASDGNQVFPAASQKSPEISTPFYSQLSAIPQSQTRHDYRSSGHPTAHYPPLNHGASPLNMSSMAGTLPDYGSIEDASVNPQGSHAIPRSLSGASAPAVVYQMGQNIQMPPHASSGMPNHSPYGNGYAAGPYQQQAYAQGSQHSAYAPFGPNQARMPPTSMQPAYQNYPGASQYMYYTAPYGHQGQYNHGYPVQGLQNQALYARRESMTDTSAGVASPQHMNYQPLDGGFSGTRVGTIGLQGDQAGMGLPFMRAQGMTQSGPVSSIPRGPPRKPKQSGHALWVGNLPPGTTVMALKDHFSREATKDIESLFLISKSNCAFVNYRSEASCTAAMHRFHDSRFNGVRLVCRLRRSSAPASGVPTGPSAMVGTPHANVSPPHSPQVGDEATEEAKGGATEQFSVQDGDAAPGASTPSSKYFIVKSLTLQDLELSVRNGIWATQSHNEEVLNKAFSSTENVYLIFSANKSGEYFGYARMTSPILDDGSQVVGAVPKPENIVDAPDVPKSIPTSATEWAPRGKIIDDSARGTIFWEAELSETEAEEEAPEKEDKAVQGDNQVVAQSWGKPFEIEWCSTQRLPFYRTRGLRNPWNANREVKIARDGTELEPSVGERLIQMFHRLGPSGAGAAMMAPHPQLGMPNMRPF